MYLLRLCALLVIAVGPTRIGAQASASATLSTSGVAQQDTLPPAKPRPLSIVEIIRFEQMHVPDDRILTIISHYPNVFDISSGNQLLMLHQKYQLSTLVLEAMIKAQTVDTANAQRALADYKTQLNNPTTTSPGASQQNGSSGQQAIAPSILSASSRPGGQALTLDDVQRLVESKVPTETIVKIIQSTPGNYHLQTDADFDDLDRRRLGIPVYQAIFQASGPSAYVAFDHWKSGAAQRKAAAISAEQKRIADYHADVQRRCPGCVTVIFYHWDAARKQNVYELPNDLLAEIKKLDDPDVARQHHVVVTADPTLADYKVIWSIFTFTYHIAHPQYASGTSSTGEIVNVYTGTTYSPLDNDHYTMYVFDPAGKQLYEAKHASMGMFVTRKADIDCWHDIEKYFGRVRAGEKTP